MVTAVSCGSATGCYMRPLLVFKEARIPFKTGCPGVDNLTFNVGISSLGWLDHKAFLHWLQHFDDQLVELCVEKPVLLLLDGHSPHVSVTAMEYAKECGIVLHQIPPHTSHLLQPLYLALYKPLKKAYRDVLIENWPQDDKVINKKQFPSIFMEAWNRSVSCKGLIEGYREAGIIPKDVSIVLRKLNVRSQNDRTPQSPARTVEYVPPAASRALGDACPSAINACALRALLTARASSMPAAVGSRAPPPASSAFLSGLSDVLAVVQQHVPPEVRSLSILHQAAQLPN